MHAAHMTHMDVVKLLIENEADINKQDNRGITTLMEASWNRHLGVVELLVKAKASLNITDERKYSALMQVCGRHCRRMSFHGIRYFSSISSYFEQCGAGR